MTTSSNLKPRTLFGTLATRPLAADMPLGTWYTDETGAVYECSPIGGVNTWVATYVPVPADLAIYVSPTGSDTNDGLTALTPLLTVQAAVRLAGKLGWTSSCIVNLAAGTYDVWPDANGDTLVLPPGYGDNCGPVMFKGATTDSGLGTLVATGGAAGSGTTTWQTVTTSSVGVPADNTLRGYFAVFAANTTTVALRGHVAQIQKHVSAAGTTTWKLQTLMATAPVASDTFTVVKPASRLRAQAGGGIIDGARSIWQWVQFLPGASTTWFVCAPMIVAACWAGDGVNTSGFSLRGGSLDIGGFPIALTLMPSNYAIGVAGQQPGCFFSKASCFSFSGFVSVQRSIVVDGGIGANYYLSAAASFSTMYLAGASYALVGSHGLLSLNSSEFDTCTGANSGCLILVQIRGTLSMNGCNIHNCTAPTAVVGVFWSGCAHNLWNNSGSGNSAAFAVVVNTGGYLEVNTTAAQFTAATPGADISIDGAPGISWADAITIPSFTSGDAGAPIQFGGGATATGGADTVFFGNAMPGATNNSATALLTPVSGPRRALKLRVKPTQNSMDQSYVLTLRKNGVATGITVSVPAGSTALVSDTTHTAVYADGDNYDLVGTVTATAGRTIQFTGTLEIV